MVAKFRIGAEVENFFNPGAPYTNVIVTNITDAYVEVQYDDGSTTVARVFPWSKINTTSILVLSD